MRTKRMRTKRMRTRKRGGLFDFLNPTVTENVTQNKPNVTHTVKEPVKPNVNKPSIFNRLSSVFTTEPEVPTEPPATTEPITSGGRKHYKRRNIRNKKRI